MGRWRRSRKTSCLRRISFRPDFFQALISQLLKLNKSSHYITFSAVEINDLSYNHLQQKIFKVIPLKDVGGEFSGH